MSIRLVTARIWFWQASAARRAGWYVRRPDLEAGRLRWFDPIISPRVTVARWFEVPVTLAESLVGSDCNKPEMVTDFGGAASEVDLPNRLERVLHHLLVLVRPVVEDVSKSDICDHCQGVDLRSRPGSVVPGGLSINQTLYLLGHPQPVHYPSLSEVIRRGIEARPGREGEAA